MSNGKTQKHRAAREETARKSAKKSWWRKPGVWLGGAATTVITGVVTGVLVNLLGTQAQQAIDSPASASTSPVSVQSHASRGRGQPTIDRSPSPLQSGPPLTVLSEDPIHDFGSTWVLPGKYLVTQGQINYLGSTIDHGNIAAYNQWFYDRGAYATAVDMQLTVQNNRSHLIRILDMNVLKSCQRPLTGTLFFSPDAGADNNIRLGFNLNAPDTEAEAAAGWSTSTWKPDYFDNYTVSIQPGAQQVFNVRAIVSNESCIFRIQATILDGDNTVYQVISDGNQPFRITSTASPFNDTTLKFSDYQVVYAGGIASPNPKEEFVRVNPKTYDP
jgi:hypothetical protein